MKKALIGVFANEPEVIGTRCFDGHDCPKGCVEKCQRKDQELPLYASGLNDDWSYGPAQLKSPY